MDCENIYCVYQKDKRCILESISIDETGRCTACIHVDVEMEVLDSMKEKLLKRFEEYDRELENEDE